MDKLRWVSVMALVVAVALVQLPVTSLAHEDGLTCHEHPTGGWSAGVEFQDSWEEQTVTVSIGGLIHVDADGRGRSRVAAYGVAIVRDGQAVRALIPAPRGTSVACSDVGITKFALRLRGPRTREEATLSITPVAPIREPGRHDARFHLETAAGSSEADGAILVVSALDGPMP